MKTYQERGEEKSLEGAHRRLREQVDRKFWEKVSKRKEEIK